MAFVVALVARILSNPLANVIQKKLTARGLRPSAVNFGTYLVLSIVSLIYAWNVPWSSYPATFWTTSAIVGILGALGNGLLISALREGELSVLGPINAYKSVVGLLAAFLLIGETPGAAGCAGIALVVWGSYYVLDTTAERFSWRIVLRKDIRYRIGAMVFAAIEAAFIKKVVLLSSPAVAFITWCWFGAIFSSIGLLLPRASGHAGPFRTVRREIPLLLAVAFCIGVMQLTTNLVFGAMDVGYALSLFQLSAVVSILFGRHFFSEKEILRKSLGAGIMIAGSVVIILFTK